jgi:hypothetical protein
MVRNNLFRSLSTNGAVSTGPCVKIDASRVHLIDNIIMPEKHGLYVSANNIGGVYARNIIIGKGAFQGIHITGNSTARGVLVENNTIFNFTFGISINQAITEGAIGNLAILNNIIWGADAGSSSGIRNITTGTAILYNIDNNAIGNCLTDYDSTGDLIIENKISLTENPFVNGSGTYTEPADFMLNKVLEGGDLCKGTATPMDMDLDGVQDTWRDIGAVQMLVSSEYGIDRENLIFRQGWY